MRLGVIGTGTIASALVRGIAEDGHQITVSKRGKTYAQSLSDEFACVSVAENQTVLDQSDVIFVGLMSEAAPDVLGDLSFRQVHKVISLMAALSLDEVAAMIAPAVPVAKMLPFPSVAGGGSPILVQGDTALTKAIFEPKNQIIAVNNANEMAAFLCAQAVLSPIARMIEDTSNWLSNRIEDPTEGEAFLRCLVTSNLKSNTATDLIEALNTPGGYNQRLRQFIETAGLSRMLTDGLDKLEAGK